MSEVVKLSVVSSLEYEDPKRAARTLILPEERCDPLVVSCNECYASEVSV